ncbi:MAG TPA: ferritin-like domain-containing protein [Leptolyngbyaceae cyanobacterium M33_DOE_097]|uniref:Ferritin-like domain-containing protein n=1 Tax=Oscillatoriales cyanobacterium SpSt-418 TaxID=2282169 RepID=A0A7C3KHC5_9CYAN|nr:ferritin-like domain-containing protein [Leptolyngbyaceae cyanobacterium M33_DOE_097]
MNLFTQLLQIIGSGAVAYISARNLRDLQTRPNTLAGLQLAESGSVPFLEQLRDRALAEGNTWLGEQLERHANDERRHGQIFAHALKHLNKQVIDFKDVPEKTADGKPDARRRSPFFVAFFKDYNREDLLPENITWEVFLASTYILELDASKDFVRMAHAVPDDNPRDRNLRLSMLSVAQDETRHAAYLKEAMERMLPAARVEQLIDEWRERKVNAMLAMVGQFLQRSGNMPSLVKDGAPVEVDPEIAPETPVAV